MAQLKEAGFNALRIPHNPASIVMLDAGLRRMHVMEESFDMWNHEKNSYDYAQEKFVDGSTGKC